MSASLLPLKKVRVAPTCVGDTIRRLGAWLRVSDRVGRIFLITPVEAGLPPRQSWSVWTEA